MASNREAQMTRIRTAARRLAIWAAAGLGIWLMLAAAEASRASGQPAPAQTGPRISLYGASVETGGTLLVEIDCRQLPAAGRDLRASFREQPLRLFPHPAKGSGVYTALVGVALTSPLGPAAVEVAWVSGGRTHTRSVPFDVTPGRYGEEALSVDPRHVRPSAKDMERIRREGEELKRIYASGRIPKGWRGGFELPVDGEVNGAFGTRRLFNGELRSQHSGVDFRAQTGSPVRSANTGVVRLAKDLFYSGNAVVLDHGAGVFTSYSHLSRIQVRAGQTVEKGEVVGLVGATGRATGPHLHWGVKVNSITVDPLAFVRVIAALEGP
jgi:hypothetical protein